MDIILDKNAVHQLLTRKQSKIISPEGSSKSFFYFHSLRVITEKARVNETELEEGDTQSGGALVYISGLPGSMDQISCSLSV